MEEGALIDEVFLSLGWWGKYQKVQFLMTMTSMLATGVHILSIVFIGIDPSKRGMRLLYDSYSVMNTRSILLFLFTIFALGVGFIYRDIRSSLGSYTHYIGRFISHRCANIDNMNISIQIGNQLVPFDNVTYYTLDNVTVTYESCSIVVKNDTAQLYTTKCLNGYNYSEPADRSIVSHWDLVCESESLSDVSQTVFLFGNLAGSLICTGLADMYGRKPTYLAAHFLMFLTAIAMSFSPNYTVFVVLKFVNGFGWQGTSMISGIILVEMFPTKRRAIPSQVGSYIWPLSLLLLCLTSYLTRDQNWRYSSLIFAGLSTYVLIQWWIMDESPRWLLANKKVKEVERIIKKASGMNNVDYEIVLEILRGDTLLSHNGLARSDTMTTSPLNDNSMTEISSTRKQPADNIEDTVTLKAFFTNRNVLFITLCSCYLWFTDNLTYYGLTMTSTSLTEDFYLGFALNVLVELPAALAFGVFINKLGRKKCITVFHITGAVAFLLSVLLTHVDLGVGTSAKTWLALVSNLIGKLSLSAAYWVVYQYTPELYPTNLRNTGFGFSSFASCVGGVIAPHFRTLERHVPWGPGVIFTCLCLLVPVIVRFLPETYGHELPQTLNDLDKWLNNLDGRRKNIVD